MYTTDTLPRTTTCPPWCIASHIDDATTHLEVDAEFTDLYGYAFSVSRFHNSRTGRSGVYLGEHEVSTDVAVAIARQLLACAGLNVTAAIR